MKRIRDAMLFASVVLVVMFAAAISGQTAGGGVAGTVKDPSGAVIKDASITLTNQATNVALTTRSTSSGTYVFQGVPVGSYTLKADAQGFRAYVLTGIQVHVQSVVTADISLQLGSVSQEVTVTSVVPLLQAQDASLGQTVPEVSVNELPLNGRNWLSLAQISAGALTPVGASSETPTQLWANGVSQVQTDYRLNGIDNNSEVFGGVSVAPVPDAIQEFKLQEGNNSAEFGQFAGSVVNALLKAGTNKINGDIWEYFRNEALNANDYFNKQNKKARQEYRQNQFGGTVGGPIVLPKIYNGLNRTFFFFDYQRTNITQQAPFSSFTVPTNGMRSSFQNNFANLQDLINGNPNGVTGNTGTGTDGLGRVFPHGTVLDPATTRAVAAGALDPISGLTNTSSSTIYVRDPFYNCSGSGGCNSSNYAPGGPLTGIKDFTKVPVSSLNVIPSSRLDQNSIALLKLLPAPTNTSVLLNNYYTVPPATQYTNQYDIRIDENLSQKDLIWGAFSHSYQNIASYQPFPGIAGGALNISPLDLEPHYELVLNYTHVFSPTLENDMTGGYDHVGHTLAMPTTNTLGIPAQYGIQGVPQTPGNGGLPTIEYTGYTSFGGRRYMPTIQADTALEFFDNLTKIRGKHEFRMGFELNHIRGNIIQPAYSKGDFQFNGMYSDIPNKNSSLLGISDMLLAPGATLISGGISNLGGMSLYQGSNWAGTRYFADYYGAYVQDNWRITPALTLNLGLRWDYSSPYGESNGSQANFQQTGGDGAGGIYYMTKKGCSVPRSTAFNALLASYNIQVDCVSSLKVNTAQLSNFGPRTGMAWRIRPNLVVRAGYGLSYGAFASVGYGSTMGTNYPFQYLISSPSLTSQTPDLLPNGQIATIETTFGAINLQDPSTVTGSGLSLFGKQYDYKTPLVQSANLTVQYQFTTRDSFQAGYVGSLGRNGDSYGVQNSPQVILPPGTNQTSYRPFPSFSANMQNVATNAISNYHSLQSIYQHQFKDNLVFLANYTYSKCMATGTSNGELLSGYRAEWLPGFGTGADYALCKNDTAHVVHVSGEYGLPFGRNRQFLSGASRMADALVGGWDLTYIYTYQSGQPFTIGCPTATSADFGCNANLVAGQNPYAGPHNVNQWLNPSAFAQPPSATTIGQQDFSPLGGKAQQVRGPGFYNFDASLLKNFTTGGETSLQLRLETFNTLNHPQFGNPGQLNFTNLTNFSKITSDRNGYRIAQLAMKFFF
jgi:Carboxypeptidase regulatory-like domain/TonB dependent receptor-like, beta-barrel